MVRPPKGAGRGRPPGGRFNKPQEATRKDDVYEAEDPEADEERHAERYDVSRRRRPASACSGHQRSSQRRPHMQAGRHAGACVVATPPAAAAAS